VGHPLVDTVGLSVARSSPTSRSTSASPTRRRSRPRTGGRAGLPGRGRQPEPARSLPRAN